MSHRLIVGLGNPGRQYEGTRHNIGFEVLDVWASGERAVWSQCKFANALVTTLGTGELLFKPQSYMNVSGEVVSNALRWYKWPVDELLVIVDDVALPVGKIRLKPEGSSGGHNGLRSIEAHLGTTQYARLRIGVGGPPEKLDLADHVLSRFLKEEKEILEKTKTKAVQVIVECRTKGIQAAMTLGNGNL